MMASHQVVIIKEAQSLKKIEDLAFYHVLSPWKQRGVAALLDVLRWLSEVLREHEDL